MRVAFIKEKYVPFGGGETYAQRLMSACAARGHEVHLVTSAWPAGTDGHLRIHVVPVARTRGARLRSFSAGAAEVVRAQGFDVSFSMNRTECQDLWRAGEGVHAVWLARRREFEPRWKTWFSERTPGQRAILDLERRCVQNTPRIIANSQMVRQDLERVYGIKGNRVTVIPNGTDLTRFSTADRTPHRAAVRDRLGLKADAPVVIFAGSGFHRKGLREALRALTRLPAATLLVLGRDDPRPWKLRARHLGVARRVRFLGVQDDMPQLYHAADVTILPTWFDSFGFVGIESLACGTPLVTTRYAGVAEAVQPGCGEVVSSPAATDELTAALQRQLEQPLSDERAAQISESVRAYSDVVNIRRTLEVIEAVPGKMSSPRSLPAL